jgi:DNA adenine methylase
MKYMGSKNRIAKEILPIMLKKANEKGIKTWVEPFVGGGNMIDKVPNTFERIGLDANPHTIQALIGIRDFVDKLPNIVSEEYFLSLKNLPPNPITSWVRIACAYGGLFGNVLARGGGRNYGDEANRNANKQSPKLQGVKLATRDFLTVENIEGAIIYCDPPYQGTSSYKTGDFPHDKFWEWCRKMAEKNVVFVSEYNAPSDFKCVWEGKIKTNFASQRNKATHDAVEKLFIYEK